MPMSLESFAVPGPVIDASSLNACPPPGDCSRRLRMAFAKPQVELDRDNRIRLAQQRERLTDKSNRAGAPRNLPSACSLSCHARPISSRFKVTTSLVLFAGTR